MKVLEHPMVTEINRTGYPNLLAQEEHCGTDFFGVEILPGDDVAEFDGDTILQENLERYLSEKMGFVFKTLE